MMSSDADEFFGKTLNVHDPADNEPATEAFVRELLPETWGTSSMGEGKYEFKNGEVVWFQLGRAGFGVTLRISRLKGFTRRQFRNLVNAMKGE